ncbi:Piso0_003478 [Millerozyma farinosa CBS 7064]|uniref:Piso0_003478 protein n=1 Tax=Pichia sorbitophila (strain ATCC MYA-4447 / BCRC 22081 / CBS 7064 / NBRC 10061 / NRRL Y-12695) TaxID=559304 RepID=G8YJ67_PICSO|nr:Piso0_003478 [Millerozyma farinosa CBS 7064]CCE81127.1 Piso0_003478 [Millerozyma farinosa CBS 7064]
MFRKLAPIESLSLNKSGSHGRAGNLYSKESDGIDHDQEEGRNSRISSFASLKHDGTPSGKNDRLGIRQFARSVMQWNSDVEASDVLVRTESNECDRDALAKGDTQKHSHAEKMQDYELDVSGLKRLQIDDGESTLDLSRRSQRKALGKTKASLENIARSIDRDTKSSSKRLTSRASDSLHQRRIVLLKNIPPNCGLISVLNQVCGGPLERIVHHDHRRGSMVELYFLYPEHARRFYVYGARTRLLVLNGVNVSTSWAGRSSLDEVDYHPPVPKYLMHDVLHYGARRCLIFSKVVPDKPTRHSHVMHYPSPRTHLSKDLHIEHIRHDFAFFGTIVDIASVISRKLCFSIHFADIRAAILAKRECETEGTTMYEKYNQWSIWYGKDPTDRPCLAL